MIIACLSMISCMAHDIEQLKADYYLVEHQRDENSELLAKYFYSHLNKRANTPELTHFTGQDKVSKKDQKPLRIFWEVNPEMQEDYCVSKTKNVLQIQVKNRQIGTWLVYELLESLASQDKRIQGEDLPVAQVNFLSECRDFDFNYREPHYLQNLLEDQSGVLGNQNVELDWGIWGHNLIKVLEDNLDQQSYALYKGERNYSQLCFTSKGVLTALSEYIIDNQGDGRNGIGSKFMITPMDNDIVCECESCVLVGNSPSSASNAVVDLLTRLSKTFENHQFYLVGYRTTKDIPTKDLPKNTGVLISTIDLPKGVDLQGLQNQEKVSEFLEQVKAWSQVTNEIYLWDYSSNFDDYLTPIPVLKSIKEQLKFFKEIGITGVFYNASGYDYSFLQDLQSYVIGNLLKDTNKNVYSLTSDYLNKFYPVSKDILLEYYLNLEKQYAKKSKAYDMYGGMSQNLQTYVDQEDLINLLKQLKQKRPRAKGQEAIELDKIIASLSFSRLQIAYLQKDGPNGFFKSNASGVEINPELYCWLEDLQKASDLSMENYKESGGSIKEYLAFWQEVLQRVNQPNLLLGKTWLDNQQANGVLNDRLIGHQNDYHIGWMINYQPEIKLGVYSGDLHGRKNLEIRFLVDKDHHFVTPTIVELWGDSQLLGQIPCLNAELDSKVVSYKTQIDLGDFENLNIIIKNPKGGKTALVMDEIQLTN